MSERLQHGTRAGRLVAAAFALAGAAGGALALAPMAGATTSASTAIKTDWQQFFAGTTSATQKIKLLQNGKSFSAIIDAQAKDPMAKSTTAKVSTVSSVTKTSAKVKYTIYLAGKAALSNQSGTAVYQSGIWKVGTSSFCALLALEGTKSTACPKA